VTGFVRFAELMAEEKIRQSAIKPTAAAIKKWREEHDGNDFDQDLYEQSGLLVPKSIARGVKSGGRWIPQ
jgi:NADP-dependent 3-hydroxy acid dehydrogenase YdfG